MKKCVILDKTQPPNPLKGEFLLVFLQIARVSDPKNPYPSLLVLIISFFLNFIYSTTFRVIAKRCTSSMRCTHGYSYLSTSCLLAGVFFCGNNELNGPLGYS